MIISRTPLRISFAGGATDIPSFYKKNDYGCVLNAAINKYIYVSVKKHSDIFKEKIRLNYYEAEKVNSVNQIKNPIIKACLKYLNIKDNIYISTIADAPGSSGLGSSSSFCVGLLNALYNYKGIRINKNKLAEDAAKIEIEILKRPIGKQDHYAAAFGGINFFTFHSDESVSVKFVDENSKYVKMMFKNLYTFYSGLNRDASKILHFQKKRKSENVEALIKIRSQAEDLYKVLCNQNFSLKKFGHFLEVGWELKKTLSNKISSKSIDDVYDLAKKIGAYGGKLSGAGGGGFLNLIAKKKLKNSLIKSFSKKNFKYFPLQITKTGSIIISK
jgi:D-glycero-alpha-D-manno-heptose-7-phosphate kinase